MVIVRGEHHQFVLQIRTFDEGKDILRNNPLLVRTHHQERTGIPDRSCSRIPEGLSPPTPEQHREAAFIQQNDLRPGTLPLPQVIIRQAHPGVLRMDKAQPRIEVLHVHEKQFRAEPPQLLKAGPYFAWLDGRAIHQHALSLLIRFGGCIPAMACIVHWADTRTPRTQQLIEIDQTIPQAQLAPAPFEGNTTGPSLDEIELLEIAFLHPGTIRLRNRGYAH